MSKKRINRIKKPTSVKKSFAFKFEIETRRIVAQAILPLKSEISRLSEELLNAKGNLVACTTCLSNKKIFTADEYIAEYNRFILEEIGVDKNGNMSGRSIFSLYNVED